MLFEVVPHVVRRVLHRLCVPPKLSLETSDLVVDLTAVTHLPSDLLDRINAGRVITISKNPANRRIGVVRQRPDEVHRDMSGGDERPSPTRANDLRN